MVQQLIARREAAAVRHDEVRARFGATEYARPELAAAMAPVVAELGAIAAAMDAAADAAPVEVARSWMWYGDAQFDLAQGGHVPFADAVRSYQQADPYLRVAKDAVLRAKWDGNLANIELRDAAGATVLRGVVARFERALGVLGATPATAEYQRGLAAARYQLEQFDLMNRELAARKVDAQGLVRALQLEQLAPAVAAAMSDLIRELAAFPAAIDDLDTGLRLGRRVREIFLELMELASTPAAPPATRGGRIAALAMQLWQDLSAAALAPIDADLCSALFEVTHDLVVAAGALGGASNDAAAIEIERVQLRGAAAAGRRLLAHAHVTWVEPAWSTPLVATLDDTAHVAGAAGARLAAITALCAARGLAVAEDVVGPDLPEQRFNAMRRAAVVIVDLTSADPAVRAAACYETGIALVLGAPLVVLAGADPLPFDVDAEPVRTMDPAALGDAIDRALVLRQRVASIGTADAMVELEAAMRRRFPDQRFLIDGVRTRLDQPLAVAAALDSVLHAFTQITHTTAIAAHPAWRRAYRTPGARRLFHIMPFRPTWADAAKAAARRATEAAGALYRRHDDVADPHILRSLWDELTRATHFLVDLTDLNPNVALELGIADTLGTPTLLVGHPGTVATLFPMLRRIRVTEYPDLPALEAACRAFVAPESA
jgi:hypothetical protein